MFGFKFKIIQEFPNQCLKLRRVQKRLEKKDDWGCLRVRVLNLNNWPNNDGYKWTLAVPGKIHKHYGSPCNCKLTKPYLNNLASPDLTLPGAPLP